MPYMVVPHATSSGKIPATSTIIPRAHFSTADALSTTLDILDSGYTTDLDGDEARFGTFGNINPDKGRFDPDPVTPNPSSSTADRKEKRHGRAKKRRREERLQETDSNDGLKRHVRRKRDEVFDNAKIVAMDMEKDLTPTKPGWIGAKDKKKSTLEVSFADRLAEGYEYVDFRGDKAQLFGTSEHGFGIICPPPSGDDYNGVCHRAADLFESYRHKLQFKSDPTSSRRGNFSAINVGVSHGGGQTAPVNLQLYDNTPVVEELMKNHDVWRIAMHANACFRTYAPELYKDYDDVLNKLSRWSPNVQRNYTNNVFACAALNLGPRTVSLPHKDFANLAWGLCSITALGSYDPDVSGHFVMEEPKLVVRFPPGSVILIPSAMITHSNTPIGPNERRYSFAQFSAGGLFHFVHNGFMTDEQWRKRATAQEKLDEKEAQKNRYLEGLKKLHQIRIP